MASLCCRNDHPINQLKLKEKIYRGRTGLNTKKCGICDKPIHRKSPRWRCEPKCAYYVCQNCYGEKTLAKITVAVAATADEKPEEEAPCNDIIGLTNAVTLLPLIATLTGRDFLHDYSDDEEDVEEAEAGQCASCSLWGMCFAGSAPSPAKERLRSDTGDYSLLGGRSDSDQTDDRSRTSTQFTLLTESPVLEMMEETETEDGNVPPFLPEGHGMTRTVTKALFANIVTAPAVGGLEIETNHSAYLLPPEVVLFEPTASEIGKPYEAGKPGKRLIFLNTKLSEGETEELQKLHKALAEESLVTREGVGDFPLYVRLHALRILQQSKFDTKRALEIMLTHLNMRVKCFPLSEETVFKDLQKGLMYWHGRDRMARPCLVWRLERMTGFTKERALKLVLFVLEYAIRFALVPGRVENWILIVDLEGVGMSHTSSANREIAKNIAILLEQVYCGRNFQTKIMSLPWVIRSIVNSFIPADKKEKVQFVGGSELQTVMGKLFEPHQLETRYGGTAPDLAPEQTYPFNFFPNARGPEGNDPSADKSLHMFADRAFHEGNLWDESSADVKAEWIDGVKGQSLSSAAVSDLEGFGVNGIKACKDVTSWLQLVNPEEAKRRQ